MRRSRFSSLALSVTALVALVASSSSVSAQTFYYPARGQTPEQQQKDQGECHVWAVQQSGYNPATAQAAPPPPPPSHGGEVVRGAGRGAAVGAVGGAIAGDAGKGAAAGAAMGGLVGGMRKADAAKAQQQAMAQQQQAKAQAQGTYQRAVAACMTGRGYSVQ